MTSVAPQLSGAVFLDQIQVLTDRYGREQVDQALAALDPQERAEIASILAMSWCRADLAMHFKDELARQVGVPSLDLQRFVSSAGIERTVRGVWRFLLKQLWDEALMKRVPMLYGKTFNRGSMRAEQVTPTGTQLVLTEWPTIPDYDAHGLAFGMEAVLSLAGRKHPKITWERVGSEVIFTARWQP